MTPEQQEEVEVLKKAAKYADEDMDRLVDEGLYEDAERVRQACKWMNGRIHEIESGDD